MTRNGSTIFQALSKKTSYFDSFVKIGRASMKRNF